MVISLAKKVEKQSKIYEKQLLKCQKFLNKNKFIIFLVNCLLSSISTASILFSIFCKGQIHRGSNIKSEKC